MNVNCYCGKGFELPYSTRRQLLAGFDAFCGEECLYQLLVDEGHKDNGAIAKIPSIVPSLMTEPNVFWCRETRRYYRSKSEAIFARWCNSNCIEWEYERYMFKFIDNKTYTPDFWLPEYSHFVEVKGRWGGSAKRKLRKAAQSQIGVILIPDYLIRKLSRVPVK
jgi:hypothetical protein